MTNTRVHPVKRVITFIMALLMILSSFVYFGTLNTAATLTNRYVYNANNWNGWFDSFYYGAGMYQDGAFSHNTVYNPFGVTSEGYFAVTAKRIETGWEHVNIATSKGSTIPSGFKMKLNINTSGGGYYYAADGNNVADVYDAALAANSIKFGCFSVAALSSPTPNADFFDQHGNYRSLTHGLAGSSGLVINFHSNVATYLNYTHAYVYFNGSLKHLIKLSDLGLTVRCNGTDKADITVELRRTGTDDYDVYITGNESTTATKLCSLTDCLDDDTQYYYAVGSFPSGMGNLSIGSNGGIVFGGAKTDGSFTIKSVGCCSNSAVTPSTFSGPQGHNYTWSDYTTYKLYQCIGCGHTSKKSIEVTYNANGGILSGGNTVEHERNTSDADATVSFTPDASIRPAPSASKPGYEFAGWSADPYATEPDTSFSSTTDTTIHAVYKKSTYTLTFDPVGGKFEDNTTANKVYNIQYGDLYQSKVGDMPNPTKRGYIFGGWIVNGDEGLIYTAPDWASDAAYKLPYSSVFTAKWTSIQGYTLTFDADGGTMPSNYQSSYLFYPDEKFTDIIGGFPVPTKPRHKFMGWQRTDHTAETWVTDWGTQPYTFGKDITVKALWEEVPGYTLTLDAGKGVFTATGDHTAAYTIEPGAKLADSMDYPIPTRSGYTFIGWQWENRTDHFWENDWGTQSYYWEGDVTFHAVWIPDHVHNVTCVDTITFDIGGGATRQYDKVECTICNDELYGFKCFFYSRNSGVIDITGGTTKCLNRDVPLTEVFDGAMVSACNTYVLSETTSATVKVKFDPFIKGANKASRDLFLGWTTGLPQRYNRGLLYTPKDGTLTMICDDNYFAYYESNCYEYLFDATNAEQYTTVGGKIEPSFAELVQENRNYGIAVVPQNGYYDDYIDYVPSMKCVDGDKLRATNTWYYGGFGLNLVTLRNYNDHTYDHVLLPGTRTGDTGATLGAPEGRMNTYYANNKGAKYVEAHYDPNYRYSGTMYYRYTKNNKGEVIWYPEFTFDVRRDPADNNPDYDPSLGQHPEYLIRDHEDYHKEFDWAVYFEDKPNGTTVIIKDPRMYTTYIGVRDPYKFIRIVAEPHGEVYESMGKDENGNFDVDITDPDIRKHEVYVKALHNNVYEGDSYIVYKKEATGENGTVHQLPDYRLARDYTKQYNNYSSRYPLYYAYKSTHNYSDYGVADYDNRFPTKFDRGTLTDRGFRPISGWYEPLWAYGDGGWNSFDIEEIEEFGYREEWGGFSQILQYPDPESTLICNNPLFTEDQRMIYQYSAYQQWDNKIQFNANVAASMLTNADKYGGYNEAYLYTVSHGNFYMPDANLFTRDRYVITGWAASAECANQGIVDFDCGEQISTDEINGYITRNGIEFVFTSFNEDGSAPTLYAV